MTFQLHFENQDDIIYLTSPGLLREGSIFIAFTTRWGGISTPPYHTLNLAFHVGDGFEKVRTNRSRLCQALGIKLEALTTAEQVHGDKVVKVDRSLVGKDALISSQETIFEADALITHLKEAPLALFFADCVPVIIADQNKKVAGVIHAGWQGIYLRILPKTVHQLFQTYQSNPSNLLVFLGPHIGKECYQVPKERYHQFKKKFSQYLEEEEEEREGDKKKKFHLDLSKIVKGELKTEGILERNIYSANICTACRPDLFFSYRASGGKTGRQGAIVVLL